MCKNVLYPVHEGMLYEIPSFGRECSDLELSQAFKLQLFDEQIEKETSIFNEVTVTLILIILFFLVALVFLQCRNSQEHSR